MSKLKKTELKCRVNGCDKNIVTYKEQLCNSHYDRFLKKQKDWDRPIRDKFKKEQECIVEGCELNSNTLMVIVENIMVDGNCMATQQF